VHPVLSIIFYVTSKKPDHEGKVLPHHLYTKNTAGKRVRIPTDVVEIGGRPKLFGLRAARKVKGFFNDVGVSALTFASTKGNFVVTNAHVVASVSNGSRLATTGENSIARWRLIGSTSYEKRAGYIATSGFCRREAP